MIEYLESLFTDYKIGTYSLDDLMLNLAKLLKLQNGISTLFNQFLTSTPPASYTFFKNYKNLNHEEILNEDFEDILKAETIG